MKRVFDAAGYATRTTGVNFEKALTWALLLGGGYLVYQVISAVNSFKGGLNSVGSKIGTGLYDVFHPDTVGETLFYNVKFPDGKSHAIPSLSVDSSGVFKYVGDGKAYQIVTDKNVIGPNKRAILV